jgi:hypothetical protein
VKQGRSLSFFFLLCFFYVLLNAPVLFGFRFRETLTKYELKSKHTIYAIILDATGKTTRAHITARARATAHARAANWSLWA